MHFICSISSEKEKLVVKGTVKVLHQVIYLETIRKLQYSTKVGFWSQSAQVQMQALPLSSLAVTCGNH